MTEETETEEQIAEQVAKVKAAEDAAVRDVMALDRAFERATVAGPASVRGGGEMYPRRYLKFRVDTDQCLPGIFDLPVLEITLRSLNAADELRIMNQAGDSPGGVITAYSKAGLYELNGAPLGPAHKEFLWEALGMGGRQLVTAQYTKIGAVSPAAMGKALATSVIS